MQPGPGTAAPAAGSLPSGATQRAGPVPTEAAEPAILTRLRTLWEAVKTSLWALPLAMVAAAFGLAYLVLTLGAGASDLWVLFGGSSSQAPSFLSSLMTAMINMATLAVSITMVVLTLAAQQLGPRLIRSFMGDRRTQAALGLFIGTVIYLLLVLRNAYGKEQTVPVLAVTGGTVLVIICLVTLLLFLHHLARSVVADSVIDRVGAQLDRDIRRLCPEHDPDDGPDETSFDNAAPVALRSGGYVQAVEFGTVLRAACAAHACVRIDLRAGHHAVPGFIAARVVPAEAASDDLVRKIQNAIVVGAERTTVQDLEYSVRQLVEVALRALSPGINDVYTALAAIDRLALSLQVMMQRGAPQSVWRDDDGSVRVHASVSTFAGVTGAAFDQIRQNSGGKPAVLIAMAGSIGQLLEQAHKDEHRRPLERHLRLVLAMGRRIIEDQDDLNDLEARARAAHDETP